MTPQSGSGELPSARVLVEVRSPGESLEATRTVNRLLGCCARDRVASGQAVRSAERFLLDRNRDESSRQAIMEGWRRVVGGMDDGLLALVATAAEQRTGLRPGTRLVRRVLSDSRSGLLASGTESAAVPIPHSRTRPASFSLGAETRNVSSWAGLLVEVCLMLRERHPGDFGRILELRGRTNPHFSRVGEDLQAPRPIGDTGIFASCQGGGAVLAARARRVVEYFGRPPESLVIRTG